ncbi:cysteine desulfurase family protein [Lutimonas zeaxanthinifaciens]|uniref:cysteine desulfurase family protein n=1 Tax=Lutimonas zeaxanthinifaciens TaxID=3060215 RepID=UPI00265CCDD3|nr:cysteine desulfurase family protein [Lutimonas sp. YSD2104]WKK67416.1 cysteine desulfurase family protein [Lutimonas sp. YSD2104]
MQKIYFDNAATTPLDPNVIRAMAEHMTDNFGNPSSSHGFGRKAKAELETARKKIASYFNCSASEVVFTAGGSEADNMVLYNAVKELGVKRIISSPLEHHAVLHTIEALGKEFDIEIIYLSVNPQGEIDHGELENLLNSGDTKTLVSLMLVNNELGNILDASRVSEICKKTNTLFHSDTVQGIGHVPIDLKGIPIDFIAASAHKFHGPKGVGFAIINKEYKFEPMLHGGEQEMGLRAGTENTHSIVGLSKALSLALDHFEEDRLYISDLKQYFIEALRNNIPGIEFNGLSENPDRSAFHILNVRFPREIPMLLFNLDLKGIAASGGSACQSGSSKGSHVLGAILSEEDAKLTSVRFSFSKFNTRKEVDQVIEALVSLT